MVNLLRPRKSLGQISNRERAFILPKGSTAPDVQQRPGGMEESRWSGENLAPSDGYSGLFASGLGFKVEREGPRPPQPQSQSQPPPRSAAAPPTAFPSTPSAGTRRRRSSILQSTSNSTSPVKYKARPGAAAGADHALEDAVRSLRKLSVATTAFSPSKQSRWSASSDDTVSASASASDGVSLPRPSFDSMRSKISLRSRKSEDKDRQHGRPSVEELMMIDVDVPDVPPLPAAPTTPRRLRGLRKLLTPKKRQQQQPVQPPTTPGAPSHLPKVPTTPSSSALSRPPAAGERGLPKKGSFASLRSLAKKGSSTTLRSLFAIDTQEPVPVPCLPHPPTTPSRQNIFGFPPACRPAKSSIGPPHSRPTTSPSKFLNEMPRRAPLTPKKDEHDNQNGMGIGGTPEMSFSTPTTTGKGTPMVFTPSFVLSDLQPTNAAAGQVTPAVTPLTAKAQKGRGRQQFTHLLPKAVRYNHGLETPPPAASTTAPLRALPPAPPPPPPPATATASARSGNPSTYTIISAYSRPSMPPPSKASRTSTGVNEPVPPLPAKDYFVKSHHNHQRCDTGTFGQRSVDRPGLDFTASPALTSEERRTSRASMMSASSDGVSAEWELEAYLREVEAREQRRANVF